jgi:hypothetical protein
MTDPYASEEESNAVIVPDTRTPQEKYVDNLLDINGAWEQGADNYDITYKVAVELVHTIDKLNARIALLKAEIDAERMGSVTGFMQRNNK